MERGIPTRYQKDLESFLQSLPTQLLQAIYESGDSLSTGQILERNRMLVEAYPYPTSSDEWEVRLEYSSLRRGLFKTYPPEPLESETIKIHSELDASLDIHDEKNVRKSIEHALSSFNPSTLMNMLRSKEPLTFSYSDRQVEVIFDSVANEVNYYIYID